MSAGPPEAFTVGTTVLDGVSVVSATGEIDLDEAAALEEALQAVDTPVVVDLTRVRFIGTRGLLALMVTGDQARTQGRRFVLVCTPEGPVDQVVGVIGGGSVFTILHELPAAIELAQLPE